jgi:hypothetical protein
VLRSLVRLRVGPHRQVPPHRLYCRRCVACQRQGLTGPGWNGMAAGRRRLPAPICVVAMRPPWVWCLLLQIQVWSGVSVRRPWRRHLSPRGFAESWPQHCSAAGAAGPGASWLDGKPAADRGGRRGVVRPLVPVRGRGDDGASLPTFMLAGPVVASPRDSPGTTVGGGGMLPSSANLTEITDSESPSPAYTRWPAGKRTRS